MSGDSNTAKPRVLIGSSVEGLPLAQAIQEQLEFDCRPKVWTENVFQLSRTAIDSLLMRLDQMDFAILVVTPDDIDNIRGQQFTTARDNVLLEFALAVGKLGRDRAFLVTPRNVPDFHLPTDLLGVEPASYNWSPGEDDWLSILGPASNRIRRALNNAGRLRPTVREWAYFGGFASHFAEKIVRAREITLYFIHSRRWRETHLDQFQTALAGRCQSLDVYLPNITIPLLRDCLISHFDDGPFVPGLVLEGFDYWRRLQEQYPGKVKVRLFDLYPTYSFYRFDSDVVVAMYPNTKRKKDVPTFQTDTSSPYWDFISDDLDQIRDRPPLTTEELTTLIARKMS